MSVVTALRALGPIDLRMIRRDSFQVAMVGLVLGIGTAFRFLVPWLTGWLRKEFDFDLVPYHALIASYILCLFPPLIVGQVIGFLLLDEKDSGVSAALRVTPLSPASYVFYRLAFPMLVSAMLTLILVPLVDLPLPPRSHFITLAILSGLEAPMFALILATIAGNKVEGFAVAKGMSSIQILPIAAMFIPFPFQWAAGVLPNYWLVRAFWVAGGLADGAPGAASSFWLLAGAALVTHAVALFWFVRRFKRSLGRA